MATKSVFHRRPGREPAPEPEPEPEIVSDSDDSEASDVEEKHKKPAQRKDAPKRKQLRDFDSEEDDSEESKEAEGSASDDSEEDAEDKATRKKAETRAKKNKAIEKAKKKAEKKAVDRRAKQEEAIKKEKAKRQKAAKEATDKKEAEAKSPTSSRNQCAVPGCTNPKFARGYCSLHIVTAADNLQPSAPQRVRNTLNLWYRRDTPSKCKITWKFVHHGHRHVVIMTFDEFHNKRHVYVDDQEQSPGARGEDCWYTLCLVGREVRFNVVVMQSFVGSAWRTDLWIDGMSFERGRERWMKHICQKQVQQLVFLPGFAAERLDKETKYLQKHWKREEVQQKTKRGNYKGVTSWHFTIKEGVHIITLEHGTTGGKRKIIVDNGQNSFVHTEKKLGFLESNSSAMYDVEVAGVHCRVCIRDLRKCERRAGLVDDADPNLGSSTKFQYDLLIEQQPFENCRMSTINYSKMGDKELIRADREVSLTDREMMRIIKMFNIDAMSLGAKRVPEKQADARQANPQNVKPQQVRQAKKQQAAPQDVSDDEDLEVQFSGLDSLHI